MGFIDRLHNAWKIFKLSFEFLGRDKSLLIVPIFMLLSGIIFCISFFIIALLEQSPLQRYVAGTVILFLLFANMWSTFLAAMQSWMVHEVAQGKDTTVFSGFKRALHNIIDIIAYSVVFLIVSMLIGAIRSKGGRMGHMAAGWLSTFAGIVGRLILPAMIVTERSFGDAVGQLKKSVHAIPEIATYEIGIRPITNLAVLFSLLFSLAMGFFFGMIIGIATAVTLILAIILLTLFINNTYYTLLYLTLIEKKHVKGIKLR